MKVVTTYTDDELKRYLGMARLLEAADAFQSQYASGIEAKLTDYLLGEEAVRRPTPQWNDLHDRLIVLSIALSKRRP